MLVAHASKPAKVLLRGSISVPWPPNCAAENTWTPKRRCTQRAEGKWVHALPAPGVHAKAWTPGCLSYQHPLTLYCVWGCLVHYKREQAWSFDQRGEEGMWKDNCRLVCPQKRAKFNSHVTAVIEQITAVIEQNPTHMKPCFMYFVPNIEGTWGSLYPKIGTFNVSYVEVWCILFL